MSTLMTEVQGGGDSLDEGRDDRSPVEPAILRGGDPGWEELLALAGQVGPRPELAHLDDATLERRLRSTATRLAAATCAWLDLVAELVIRNIWADQGARTPAVWLSWAVGMAPATAREQVRVALRLRELPRVRERFAQGRISYSKVRAIVRVALPDTEELLLRWADEATGADLDRIVRGFRSAQRGRAMEPAELERERGVRLRSVGGGRSEVVVRLPDDEAHALHEGLQRLADLETDAAAGDEHVGEDLERGTADDDPTAGAAVTSPDEGPGDAAASPAESPAATTGPADADAAPPVEEPRPWSARLADALTEAVAAAVAVGGVDTTGADRHTLVVEVGQEELAAAPNETVGVDTTRGRIPAMSSRILRRIACNAGVVPVVTDHDGTPMDVGRRERRLSTALRRALLARDRSCRFPGCGARRHLHAHHIRHWADGGPTDLANLVLLCGHHHRYVHAHDLDIRLRPGGAHVFRRPDGRAIPRSRPLPGTVAPGATDPGPADPASVDPGAPDPEGADPGAPDPEAAEVRRTRATARDLPFAHADGNEPTDTSEGSATAPPDALQPRHWDGKHSLDMAVAVLQQEIAAVLPQAALAA